MDKVKQLEARTQHDLIELMHSHGLGKVRRRKMLDYTIAKKICFEGLIIDPHIYDRQIDWIMDWLMI
jgi:hypothetical protein